MKNPETVALHRINRNLRSGLKYGYDYTNCFYPFFSTAIYFGKGRSGKNLFFWQNYGSSANPATIADLKWIIETIFKTTPTGFEKRFILDTESKIA